MSLYLVLPPVPGDPAAPGFSGVQPLRTFSLRDSDFGIHLQWFAAEDEGRTEEPTEQKIRKAREEGKVAKSTDLTGSLVLLFAVLVLAFAGKFMLSGMADMMRYFFSRAVEVDVTTSPVAGRAVLGFFLRIFGPMAAVTFVGALAGNILQVGFLFSTKPITPDFSRIVPRFGKWIQRSFASGEAAFNLMKSVVKVVIIGIVAFLNIRGNIESLGGLINGTFLHAVEVVGGLAFRIMIQAAVLMLVFSLADYWFQRRQYRESLKMSKHEVKEERKQAEGDPLVKSRLKERMRSLLANNMWKNLPEADVVVTNPTHFAVALQYRPGAGMPAPMVIGKGQDNIALRIRETAEVHGVPIIENKPLARALFAEVEIGDVIPDKFYEAMALIIKQVYEMKGIRWEAV